MANKLASIADIVDSLGKIKADIADLKTDEEKAVKMLKARGNNTYCGKLFEALVFEQERNKQINYEAIAKDAKIDKKLIEKYTTTQTVTTTTIDWETVLKLSDVDKDIIAKHTTSDKIQICKVSARK